MTPIAKQILPSLFYVEDVAPAAREVAAANIRGTAFVIDAADG